MIIHNRKGAWNPYSHFKSHNGLTTSGGNHENTRNKIEKAEKNKEWEQEGGSMMRMRTRLTVHWSEEPITHEIR